MTQATGPVGRTPAPTLLTPSYSQVQADTTQHPTPAGQNKHLHSPLQDRPNALTHCYRME